jgi:hypothetical protein
MVYRRLFRPKGLTMRWSQPRPAYDLVFRDFNTFTHCDARSRSQQLILFSLDAEACRFARR